MKKTIKKLIESTGYTISKKPPASYKNHIPLTKANFFDLFFSLVKDPFFVQIGAHDGKYIDPLYRFIIGHKVRGIAVEPQPDAFERLQETYKDYPNVQCVNALIGEGVMPFYVIKKWAKAGEDWAKMAGIASIYKNTVIRALKKKIPKRADPEDYIEKVDIEAISLPALLENYQVRHVDFLQMDCQGHDFEILKTLDFTRFHPRIINLESSLFTEKTLKECDELLTKHGYRFFRDRDDTCAYRF